MGVVANFWPECVPHHASCMHHTWHRTLVKYSFDAHCRIIVHASKIQYKGLESAQVLL